MTAANTRHGNFSAHARAERHHVRTFTARNRLVCTATLLWPLPPARHGRPPRPGPSRTPRPGPPLEPALPHAAGRNALQRENPPRQTRAQTDRPSSRAPGRPRRGRRPSPWRQAIAQARAAKHQQQSERESSPSPLEGEGRGEGSRRNAVQRENAPSPADPPTAATSAAPATPVPPPATWRDLTLLQRELAARLAGLRGTRRAQPPNHATPGPQAGPKSPERNAIHREPATNPTGANPPTAHPTTPAVPSHPASHKPPAPTAAHPSRPPLAARQTKTPERIAVQREDPTPPPLTRLTPTKAQALRTTIPANTWTPDLPGKLAQRFGHPRPAPGWRIPHAMPATDPVANAARSFLAGRQRPTDPAVS